MKFNEYKTRWRNIYVDINEYINTFIYEGLKYLGVRFWIKDGELAFKYPEGLGGDRKSLYKFIKEHQETLKRALQK